MIKRTAAANIAQLTELADFGLTKARDVAAQAKAAKTAAEAADLAEEFERVSLAVCQSLVLIERLERDQRHEAREFDVRKQQFEAAVKRATGAGTDAMEQTRPN